MEIRGYIAQTTFKGEELGTLGKAGMYLDARTKTRTGDGGRGTGTGTRLAEFLCSEYKADEGVWTGDVVRGCSPGELSWEG